MPLSAYKNVIEYFKFIWSEYFNSMSNAIIYLFNYYHIYKYHL